METAPTPFGIQRDIEDIKFINVSSDVKLNDENYTIAIGTLKDILMIKASSNYEIKKQYQANYTFEELKNIAKAMRYFDNINDVVSFIENKGKKNEIFLKKENDEIYINFKAISINGKEEDILLKLKPSELNDKEIISLLIQKIDCLEKEIKTLKERINTSDNNISILFSKIESLEKELNKKHEAKSPKENSDIIDSTITNENELTFIINYLKNSPFIKNKNFKFNLLYRGTRDGDDTKNVHKMCCGKKNVIIFMKSEQGKRYGGFSNIGWESKNIGKYEYPIDDNAFLFSIDSQKIFQAQKGKNQMCWLNGDEYGLCFCSSLIFYNNFMTRENTNLLNGLKSNFIDCNINEFNSGLVNCKFSELEVFAIY